MGEGARAAALDRAIDAAARGDAPAVASDDVARLLRVAAVLSAAMHAEAREEARAASRARLMEIASVRATGDELAVARARHWNASPGRDTGSWSRRLRTVAVAVAATMALSGAAFAAAQPAASSSIPGDLLYPVKLAGERVRLVFTRGAAGDAGVHLGLAEKRIAEMARAVHRERASAIGELARRHGEHLGAATELAGGDTALLALILSHMEEQRERILAIAERAPEAARAGLERAAEASMRREEALRRAPGLAGRTPPGRNAETGETGRPGGPGRPDDAGRPDDPGQSGDRGQPGDAGQPEDTREPGRPAGAGRGGNATKPRNRTPAGQGGTTTPAGGRPAPNGPPPEPAS